MESHAVIEGKLRVYRRERSSIWQASTYVGSKELRRSTREKSLARAKEVAEDWYLGLRGKILRGEIKREKTFAFAAEQFLKEYTAITIGERNEPVPTDLIFPQYQLKAFIPKEFIIDPFDLIFAPAGLRCGSLAVTRPPHKPRLASKRENEVKWVNNKFLWYKSVAR